MSQDQKQFTQLRKKYFPLFDELKTSQLNTLIFYPLFLLRRFLLVIVLIGLREHPLVQIIQIVLINLAQVVYVIVYRPFIRRIMNITHIILEVWFITLNTFNFYFYTLDDEKKARSLESVNSDKSQTIGFIVVSLSNFVTLFGIIICLYSLIKETINQAKAKKTKKQNKIQDQKAAPLKKVNTNLLKTFQESFGVLNAKEENSTFRDLNLNEQKEKNQIEEPKNNILYYVEEEKVAQKKSKHKSNSKSQKDNKLKRKKKQSDIEKNEKSHNRKTKIKYIDQDYF